MAVCSAMDHPVIVGSTVYIWGPNVAVCSAMNGPQLL